MVHLVKFIPALMLVLLATTSVAVEDTEKSASYPAQAPRGIKGSSHFAAEPTAVRTGPRHAPLSSGTVAGRGNHHVAQNIKRRAQGVTRNLVNVQNVP
mmetsp:Transcript_6311/g.12627  ORF Transcript_6311/g.12627 Transcript_6311/m.12627 type:complete len:98 (-) Transcript_6311:286-579(-)